jgi:hypothetical protein
MADMTQIPNGKTVKYILSVIIGVLVIIGSGYIGKQLEKSQKMQEQVIINTEKIKILEPLPSQMQELREMAVRLGESMSSVKSTVDKMDRKLDEHVSKGK